MAGESMASYLTRADIERALRQSDENRTAQIERENEAHAAFLAAVPEAFRDHPEIRRMAVIVAMSQTMPMHPNERERLQRRYDEIVNGE